MEYRELTAPQTQPELTERPPAFPIHPERYINSKFLIEPAKSAESGEDFALEVPPDSAPYSLALARIGITRFELEDMVPTPVDEDGLVDFPAMVRDLRELAPDHQYDAPFFDLHHLVGPYNHYELPNDEENFLSWTNADDQEASLEYTAEETEKVETRREFHSLPRNLIWWPRGVHDVAHARFIVAPDPSYEVMRRENKKARRTQYLYGVANQAISLYENRARMELHYDAQGNPMWVDKQRKRTYHNMDIGSEMEQRRQKFIRQILRYARKGVIDLSRIAPLELIDKKTIEQNLKGVAQVLEGGVIAIRNKEIVDETLPIRHVPRERYRKGAKTLDQAA